MNTGGLEIWICPRVGDSPQKSWFTLYTFNGTQLRDRYLLIFKHLVHSSSKIEPQVWRVPQFWTQICESWRCQLLRETQGIENHQERVAGGVPTFHRDVSGIFNTRGMEIHNKRWGSIFLGYDGIEWGLRDESHSYGGQSAVIRGFGVCCVMISYQC